MPKTNDTFEVALGNAQLDWGTYRNPTNRNLISGESYIAIPKKYAVKYGIYNSNHMPTGLGYNEFIAFTADGFIHNEILLAQGNSRAGDPYAKNFSIKRNLKRIGEWFAFCGATTSNKVKVTFTSPTTVLLELI